MLERYRCCSGSGYGTMSSLRWSSPYYCQSPPSHPLSGAQPFTLCRLNISHIGHLNGLKAPRSRTGCGVTAGHAATGPWLSHNEKLDAPAVFTASFIRQIPVSRDLNLT